MTMERIEDDCQENAQGMLKTQAIHYGAIRGVDWYSLNGETWAMDIDGCVYRTEGVTSEFFLGLVQEIRRLNHRLEDYKAAYDRTKAASKTA